MYSTPLYKNIPGRPVQYASTILACLAFVVTIPIYIVYKKGPEIRAKSKFAQTLDKSFTERKERRGKTILTGVNAEKEVKKPKEHA
jgi:MFS-type transporter involved in bile tolerance (Atg22 family)